METATTEAVDLLAGDMSLARDMIADHIVEDDGEQCFNLFTYLLDLEFRIGERHCECDLLGHFSLSSSHIARYLWCCIALSEGHTAYPDKFRGMGVLD